MMWIVVEKTTGKIVGYARHGTPPHDPATQSVVESDSEPDYDAQRWDFGTQQVRSATAQELADDAASQLAALKARAKAYIDELDAANRALRAVVRLTVDELNMLRSWVNEFKTQAAAATSLGNFQARIASLPDLPERTYTQAKAAIDALVDGDD